MDSYGNILQKLIVQKICHSLVWKSAFPRFTEFSCNISLFEIPLEIYKGFSKFIKEKFDFLKFQIFYFKTIIYPKSDVPMGLLRPRGFSRHQDRPNWLMSNFDVICVIWCHKRHLMSNDAYDIKICHKSIWPILVSKEASRPQWSNL
jgi:hypothetical protein